MSTVDPYPEIVGRRLDLGIGTGRVDLNIYLRVKTLLKSKYIFDVFTVSFKDI